MFFNPSTQQFIMNAKLQPGMKVLDIGCGSGVMTAWLAQQMSSDGIVVAIDNSEEQIKATEKQAANHSLNNIKTHCLSAMI